MKSILHHPPPLSTLFTHAPPPPPPPPPTGVLQRLFPKQMRPKPLAATSSHLVSLLVNSPATTTATATPPPSANIAVLITTSIGFAFLYWIANFVVPEFIMKDLQSQDADKDQNPNDQNWID
ncbi:hypothetical protein SSX86_000424 [Deinandra increscens subsp. villosa]|uniref:Uncharacterized protein n=1 Tax=Deinandra increscens subsp. villosa TaxID=3103831 RepID=A0AAP0DT46_9ASTR